jgi:CRISPR-associated protein Csb1
MTQSLTLATLTEAVSGAGVGFRCNVPLEPLGGPGDKIFPASYGVADSATTKYAIEDRQVDGQTVRSTVVDSVASQANRQELALLEAIRTGELKLPLVSLDFESAGLPEFAGLSSLEVPHRIYDAILRDSLLGGVLFRLTDIGRSITEATFRNAGSLFAYAPQALLYGAWDSTGPRGGRGSKFERAITSEIVAHGVSLGVKTASRLDPLAIEKAAGPLYKAKDGDWTLDEKESTTKELFKRKGSDGKAGDPSHANHGNIAPSIDMRAGGVTADSIEQTIVISFVALRKLSFPTTADGVIIDPANRKSVDAAARTAIAAIGIAGTVLSYEAGYDLRSRCVLTPSAPLEFELINRGSATGDRYQVTRQQAIDLVHDAAQASSKAGLTWRAEPLQLTPSPKLVELVKRSKDLSVAGSGEVD